MTSTASKPKNYTSLAFKRNFKSTLVNTVLALGACIVTVLISISSKLLTQIHDGGVHNYDSDYYTSEIVFPVVMLLTVIAGFFSLTVAPRMFKQIYKKQSCDSYFAVPIKREEYFVANYLYGLFVNVLCFVIPLAICFGANRILTDRNLIDYSVILPVSAAFLLCVIAIYSAFVMCAVISGKRIQYLILSLICLICTTTTISGIVVKISTIWGFSADLTPVCAVSPIENAFAVYGEIMGSDGINLLPLIIISLVEIIVLFTAGYIAFKNRKAETAEASLSGKVLPFVILAILVGAAFFFSATGSNAVDLIIGIVLAVLITMAFSAIFYKKVFTKQTAITLVIVCSVCTVLSVAVTLPIFNGYVKYVPEADEVESVEFSSLSNYGIYEGVSSMLNYDLGYSERDTVTVVQQENIEKVIALHNKSVDDTVINTTRKNNGSSWLRLLLLIDDRYYGDYRTDLSYKISYKLTDGSTVVRSYSVANSFVKEQFFDVIQTEEALSQLKPMSIKNDEYLGVTCTRHYEKNYETNYVDVELVNFDIEKFNKALLMDYLSMERNIFINEFEIYPLALFEVDYVDACETLFNIEIYYATDGITDEELEKYKNMSASQLKNTIYYDNERKLNAEYTWVNINENYVNTIEYLNSCGGNLK